MNQRIIRFARPDSPDAVWGTLEGDQISVLRAAPWQGAEPTGETLAVDQVALLAPVDPSKIICIGLNYRAHVQASQSADEAPENPLIFLKPPSSVIASGEKIIHPPAADRVDYEAELGVVIGKTGKNILPIDVEKHIFGFTCVNDVTARDLQKKDGQWSRAKGFDTFCPVGPWIVTELNYSDVLVEGILNDEVKQSGRTSLMIFDIPYLISYVSSVMTLFPGDLISTGTPAGIAPMMMGDKIEVRIEGVGTLENRMA